MDISCISYVASTGKNKPMPMTCRWGVSSIIFVLRGYLDRCFHLRWDARVEVMLFFHLYVA